MEHYKNCLHRFEIIEIYFKLVFNENKEIYLN